MNTHSEYTSLFRTIAERHKSILHTDSSMHFARIIVSANPFRNYYINEFLEAEKASIKTPFMLLESYDSQIVDKGSDNFRENKMGALVMLTNASRDAFDDEETALDQTERLCLNVLSYLKRYTRKHSSIYTFDFNQVHLEKVGPISDSKFFGTRMDFEYEQQATTDLKWDGSLWTVEP